MAESSEDTARLPGQMPSGLEGDSGGSGGGVRAGDARSTGLPATSVDLVMTSPPYWRKRDYGHPGQIGQEATPGEYVDAIRSCLVEWGRVLRRSGSVFLNVGDTYDRRGLAGIPGRIEEAARGAGWLVRNRIIWAKDGGMPEPARDRLAGRHEYVIHLVRGRHYFYDLAGYAEAFGSGGGANPGDVWTIQQERNTGEHLAPFPAELVRRALLLACPLEVCKVCAQPRRRIVERTADLDPSRPQARRAMELASQHGLTSEHFAAIRATGVSDVGKAVRFQAGAGRNSPEVQRLAGEAKAALGGYFREFTFGKLRTVGWSDCGHSSFGRGVVLDPFAGTGTTLRVAAAMGFEAVGLDLRPGGGAADGAPRS